MNSSTCSSIGDDTSVDLGDDSAAGDVHNAGAMAEAEGPPDAGSTKQLVQQDKACPAMPEIHTALLTAAKRGAVESSTLSMAIGRLRGSEFDISSRDIMPASGNEESLANSFQAGGRTFSRLREMERGTLSWYRYQIRRIVLSSWFDAFIGALVVVNAVLIGVEQAYKLEGRENEIPLTIVASEHIFLSIYTLELIFRFFGCGWQCFEDNGVKFDILLVSSSIIYAWFLEPIDTGSETGGLLVVLRTVKLARLARAFRLLIRFRVLWMLVRGLLTSAQTMIYTLIVLVITLFVFATIGTELITLKSRSAGHEGSEEFQEIVDRYFSTLPDTMLTLLQFACLDSIGAIYRPMIQHDYTLAVCFMMIILVIPVVLMNLVTAIIVNGAMEQANQDREVQKLQKRHTQKMVIDKVGKLFRELDGDDSGMVSRDEMGQMSEDEKELLCNLCGLEDDPLVIFDRLDVDGSGEIDIDEFCAGILKVVTATTPIEIQRMEKLMEVLVERQRESDRRQEALAERMSAMQVGVGRLQESFDCSRETASNPMSMTVERSDFAPSPLKQMGIDGDAPPLLELEAPLVRIVSHPLLSAPDEPPNTAGPSKKQRSGTMSCCLSRTPQGSSAADAHPAAWSSPLAAKAEAWLEPSSVSSDIDVLPQEAPASPATHAAEMTQQLDELLAMDSPPSVRARAQEKRPLPAGGSLAHPLEQRPGAGPEGRRAASLKGVQAELQRGAVMVNARATPKQSAAEAPQLVAGSSTRCPAGDPASALQGGGAGASLADWPAALAPSNDGDEEPPTSSTFATTPETQPTNARVASSHCPARRHRVVL